MFQKKKLLLLTIVVLPLYLFLSVFGVKGSFLCFGEDGHVAMEFMQSCNSGSADEGLAESDQGDACGPCTDVHFLKNADSLKSAPQTTNTLSAIHDFSSLDYLSPRHYSGDGVPILFLDPQTKNLAKIQSVVLLI